MALNDKNIVITPNIGQANDPKIDFTGANANTSGTITLTVLPANGGTVQYAGAAGTILTLANTITNTVVSIPSTLNTTSTTTGALTVAGGVGIGQDLRVGGSIYGTFAGTIPINVTNNTTSATTQYLVFVSTSSGNVSLQVSAPTGITYQPSTGNFGLGVPNPSYRLDMSGGQKIDSATGGYLDLFYNGVFSGNIKAASGALYVNTSTTTNTLINASGGNVGIRQVTPLFPLHVYADSKKQLTVSNGSGSTTKQAGINYRIDSTDLWQTYVNNASNNNWYIRYNDTTDVFTADTSGNIGIGTGTTGVNITTPAPGRYLEIYAPGTTPALRLINDAATPAIYQLTAGIPNVSTTGFSVWSESSGAGVFNIDSSGKASINTQTVTNNNYFLDVWGSIGASIGSVTIGQGGAFLSGSIFSNSTYGMIQRAKSTPSAAGATFAWVTQANTELMRLDPNGNWALGTTNAFEKWVLLGSANTATHTGLTYNMIVNSSNALTPTNPSGVGGGIAFGGIITGTTTATFAIVSGVKENANYNDNAGAFIIGTRANGALVAEAVRVTSAKSVGIGTPTPVNRLQVVGGNYTIGIADSASGNRARLFWQTTSGSVGVGLFNDDNSNLMLGTNGTEKLRIDVNGNVIIASGYLKLAGGLADNSGTGSALNVTNPGGASFAASPSTQTGAIKIRLPQGYTDTMMRMTVKVYTYDGQSFDITCGGYTYGGGLSWLNTFAYLNTKNRGSLNVRFGYDGTYNCIFIGEINTTWSYPQVFITDFQAGYNNYAYTQWINNWNVSFYSTAAFANTGAGQYITSTVTAYPAWTTGSLTNVSQLTNDAGYLTGANTVAKYTLGNNGVQPCWIYMGRWNTAQQGYTLRMTITGMQGYNASASQNQTTQIYFKTSNTSSSLSGSTGAFYADGQAYRYGANSNGPQTIRVVQIDQNTYDFYSYWPGLIGQGSMYEVVVSVGTWVNSSTVVTPTGNYYDLAMYVGYTSQSLTALSQLTNDVPYYKSGDSPTFGTVTANSYAWNGSGSTVGYGMLNMTHDSQTLFNGSSILGDGVNSDLVAFNMPNTTEYYNGTSWSSTATSAFYDVFRGKVSQRFGGPIALNSTTQQRIRFTWNSWGYKFWNGIIVSSNLQGNNLWITLETSADGTTWTTQINDVDTGSDWPGYHYIRNISNNSGSSPWLRITLRRNTTGASVANLAYINNISVIGSYGGYNNLFDWDYQRNITFPGNLYAPIYYDANNSAYYTDPASTSALNAVTAAGTVTITSPIGDGVPSLILAPTSSSGTFQWASRSLSSSLGSGQTMIHLLGNATGTNNSGYVGYNYGGTAGSTNSFVSLGLYGNDNILRVYPTYTQSAGSMRAPIFYDLDDTTYYANPNGASNFNQLKLTYQSASGLGTTGFNVASTTLGGIHFNNGTGPSGNGVQAAITFMGSAADAAQAGIYVHNNNSQGTHMAFATTDSYATGPQIGQYIYNTGQVYFPRSYVSAAGSFRAPIFYDLDNTAYYVDPTSTSYIAGLQVLKSSNPINFTSGWSGTPDSVTNVSEISNDVSGYQRLMIVGNKSGGGDRRVGIWDRLAINGGTFSYNLSISGTTYSSTSVYSPIYYDSDNTNYYVDPASTSILNNLTVNGSLSIGSINPLIQGPLYTYYSGNLTASATQALRYEVARIYQDTVNWKTSGMVKIELHNYYYTGNDWQVWMVGYHGTTTYAHMVDGNAPFGRWAQVTLGTPVQYSGNIYYLPIYVDVRYYSQYYTYVSTDWPRITTTSPSVSAGYGAIYIFPTPSGSNLADFTPSTTHYTSDIITTGASVRAPIFYDLDNTGYYTDPASISSMYGIAIRGDSNSTDTSNQIFFWGSGNSTTSAIGFKASGGAFPNPTGNGDGYNTYFSMDTAGRGWVFRRSPGGSDFSAAYTSGWILNNGIWQSNASMRSPIFYDADNTAYYTDPASGSNLYNVTLRGPSFSMYTGTYGPQIYPTQGGGSAGGGWARSINFADGTAATTYGSVGALGGVGTVDYLYFAIGTDLTNYANSPYIRLRSGNYTEMSGSARSPIFYDLDNTGYYADPASQSFFYQINTQNNGGTQLFIGNGSVSTSNRLTINFHTDGDLNYYIGKPAGGWTQPLNIWFYTGVRLYAHQSYDYGVSMWNVSSGNIQASFGQGGDVIYLYRSTYAPIVYDRDNSGYYIDPASTSNLNVVNIQQGGVAGRLYFSGVYGNTYNSDPFWFEGRYIAGNVTALDLYIGDDGRNSVLSSPINGWGGQDGTIDYFLIRSTNQGIHHIFGSDGDYAAARTIYAPSESVRAPIFYDYNDTGYYVNPNGTSNLYYVISAYGQSYQQNGYNNAGGFAMNNASTYWGLMINYSPNDWRLGWGATTAAYGWNLRWDNGGTTWSNYSHRAPIFYDADNTGYYVNPDSSSNLYALTVNQIISGGIQYSRYVTPYITYANNSSPITGTVNDRNSPFYGMYTYHTYGNTNITPMYFGTGFGWGNGVAGSAEIVANWVNGGNPSGIYWRSLRDCCTNWTSWARFLTSYDDPYAANMDQYVRSSDSPNFSTVYAYNFYDRNNTSYYVDPASGSNFNYANFQGRTYHYNYIYVGNAGGIMGDYNSAGTATKVIWTIGESWPLGNMYGLAYEYSSSPYLGTDHTIAIKNNGSTYGRWNTGGGGLWTSGPFSTASWSYFGGLYDYDDTGYYLNPNSDSNLYKPTYAAQQRWNISRRATARSEITSDSNYWTNTAGWGTSYGTWNSYWEYGFGGFDCWGTNTGHPQGSGYVHAQGIQSGLHYATSGGGAGYGWQMVGAADATSNRYWARGKWGSGTSGWLEFVMSNSNPGYTLYANIMYDGQDTGYYFDPNGTSNLNYITSRSKDRIGLTAKWNTPRSDYTSDSNYWTGTMGWGGNDANTITGWGNGFFDSWGVGTGQNFPPSTSHFEGIQAFHYTYGNGGYGWQMVNGGGSTSVWFRPMWYSPGSWQNFAFYGINNYSYTFYASTYYDSNSTGYYMVPGSYSRTSNIGTDYLHAYNNQSCNLRSNGASYSGSTSGIGPYMYTDGNNNAAMFAFHKGGYYAVNMGLDADNVIRIGGWSASSNRWQLDMSGNMYAAGNITAYSSDRRLKKNVQTIENAVGMLKQLRGVYFDWEDFVDDLGFNPIDRHDIGVIAQEVQPVIPMAIKPAPFDTGGEGKSESGQNYLTVQIEKIIPVLIEAVKHQQEEIERLKKLLSDRFEI